VQRRYWESADGRRSKIEVVAAHVTALPNDRQEPQRAALSDR
jgi:hypothetical protein